MKRGDRREGEDAQPGGGPDDPPRSDGGDPQPRGDRGGSPAGGDREFLGLVAADLRRRRIPFEIAEGAVHVPSVANAQTVWGLSNLARSCASGPRASWERTIAEHFDRLATIDPLGKDVDDALIDFANARDRLRVRLFPAAYRDDPAAPPCRALADGLFEFLVLDHPDHVATVGPAKLRAWNRALDELFEIGRANLRAEPRPSSNVWELAGGVQLDGLAGASVYASTQAVFLEELVAPAGPRGALVAVPDRHTILHHPIEKETFERALWQIAYAAQRIASDGPGTIGADLYWWRPQRWVRLPTAFEGDQVRLDAPREFAEEVLDRL